MNANRDAASVRLLTADDAAAFHALRLVALRESPTAFGASVEFETDLPRRVVVSRIAPHDPHDGGAAGVFHGGRMVGMACVHRDHGRKMRHRAILTSVYIAPDHRGRGLSAPLLQRMIDLARAMPQVRRLNLRVNAANLPAQALYRRAGFVEYGREPEGLWVDGIFHDEILMTLAVQASALDGLAARLRYEAVDDADFDALADIRIAAMRDSLVRVGRFDPERARQRLRASYSPQDTWAIVLDDVRVGFYALRREADALKLDHLYILPGYQAMGLGAEVLRRILRRADRDGLPVRLGALRDSDANRFYQRHGFVRTGEDSWDIYYERSPLPYPASPPQTLPRRE
jgi:RimJ/RimL family protein N-acetyltransferase